MNAYRSERRENGGIQTIGLHIAKSQNGLLLNPSSSVHPSTTFASSWTMKTKNKNDTQSSHSRSSSSSIRLHEFKSHGPQSSNIVDFSVLPGRKEEKRSAKEPSSITVMLVFFK